MKLVCNGNDLAEAVSKVFKAVSSNALNPLMEGIKLKAENGTLILSATDFELSIEKMIRADIKTEGETVVPGKIFADFVKKLTRQQIELLLSDNKLQIRYEDSQGFLNAYNAEQFPEIKRLSGAQSFKIKTGALKDLINKTSFSVSTDEARPILKGILLELNDQTVTAVALDGYRLAKCEKPLTTASAMMSAVVPARALNEIARLIGDEDDELEVFIQKNYLMAEIGHTLITSRLLEGDFVNYRQIIPSNFESTAIIPKQSFEDALERAVLLSKSDKNYLVKFDIKESNMTVSSYSELGNIEEHIIIKLIGVDLIISFNARYFTELLRNINCENITIKFINSVSPCIVSGNDNDSAYLILPVRTVN